MGPRKAIERWSPRPRDADDADPREVDGAVAKPWSPLARDDLEAGHASVGAMADSQAARRLVAKIMRYAQGGISGHAVLVAGHRGAGKTTAVRTAMQGVYNRYLRGNVACRPLLVPLHGPSLLLGSTPANPDGGDAGGGRATPSGDPAGPVTPATAQRYSRRFLQEMAAGILPALLLELRHMLEERVEQDVEQRPEHHQAPRRANGREIIAHIIDELPQGMSLAELRELYRRLGLLPDGLLRGDAFEEITAINAAGEAYAVVTGEVGDEKNFGLEQKQAQTDTANVALTGETLTKALTTVGAAVAAAFGLANDSAWGAVASAAVILAGGLSLSSSSTRERSTNAARKRSFKQDNSLESLVRRVPLLVDQLRAVGLPPVFVVDELDKIEDPPVYDLLDGLMRNLKSYVTERSLILFVADRKYYDRISRAPTLSDERYGVAHTFYGERVYVISAPSDVHGFLRRTLREDEVCGEEDLPAHLRAERRRAFALVRHALLHRGRMHPYDVSRQLDQARNNGEHDRLRLGPATLLRNRVTRYQAFFQLCFEWVLAAEAQQREIAADPYYSQIAYDALYGISDRWKSGRALRDPEAAEAEWIEAKAANLSQRGLLRTLTGSVMRYLARPALLAREVANDLDMTRLRLYLVEGEDRPATPERDRVLAELGEDGLRGRDPGRVADALATSKYELLRGLCDQLDPMLDPDQPTDYMPRVDPRGYGQSDPRINEEEESRVQRLQTIRHWRAIVEVGFETLWSIGVRSKTIGQLDSATEAASKPDAAPEDIDDVRHFAAEAPAAERVMLAALLGVHVMATIAGTEVGQPHAEALTGLVVGTGPRARFDSVMELIRNLVRWHDLTLSNAGEALLEWDDAAVTEDTLDAALAIEGSPVPRDGTRADWEESLAERMRRRLLGKSIAPLNNRYGKGLDTAASLNRWFPAPLRIWLDFPEPGQWTIKVWSDVLLDPAVGDAVHAMAAAQLAMPTTLRTLLETGKMSPPTREWLGDQLRALEHQALPSVVLVNPGPVLGRWNPVPGVSVRVLEAPVFDASVARGLARDYVVFRELPEGAIAASTAARPEPLEDSQYVLVHPRTSSRGWEELTDGTPVFHAPHSLRAALELHHRVFSR